MQATTSRHIEEHLEKFRGMLQPKAWIQAGGELEIWGWRLLKEDGWQPMIRKVTLEDLEAKDG